jgi:hypothetical protein
VIIAFYDLFIVVSTLPGKREYFTINVHNKCAKLTAREFRAIALMSLVTLNNKYI